jgi:hypothetical protein
VSFASDPLSHPTHQNASAWSIFHARARLHMHNLQPNMCPYILNIQRNMYKKPATARLACASHMPEGCLSLQLILLVQQSEH